MTPRRAARLLILFLTFTLLSPAAARAQGPQRCTPPALSQAARAGSIFTPQQEMDLGDVIAEQAQRDYRVIEDEEVTGYLRRVGARLVEHLPPTEMRYRFFVVDLPDANAFTSPGGRIYVTRKLIAFAASEDELAGVLAHELGHAASGQISSEMTRLFREVLGVTKVGDRRDIFEKYNQLLDNAARKPGAWKRGDREEEGNQFEADRIGIYAMAAAGYDPQSFASMWERMTETKGRSGGWLSDLFGTTRPDERRTRAIRKELQTLPAECVAAHRESSPEEFKKWQAAVVGYGGARLKESLHGVVSQTRLDPPLRQDITHLRFSPDGRYLLAQDDGGIDVLTRDPLKHLFRIEAAEAQPAQFTPDSQGLVFHNRELRVEEWDVAAQKQKSAKELYAREGCIQTALSPDGHTLACLDAKFGLTLYDVAAGTPFFQKKEFYKPDLNDQFRLILYLLFREEQEREFDWITMDFSPDSHYFAAGQRALTFNAFGLASELSTAAVDLTTHAPVNLGGNLKKILGDHFAFVAPDRIAGVNAQDVKKSGIVSFPAGEVVEQFPLSGSLESVTRGDYLMISGLNPQLAVMLFDLKAKKFVRGSRTHAMDVYDRWTIGERTNGELGLYEMDKNEPSAVVTLPRNPLGRLRAAAVSPDLKWLAVSERSRGAVWDLTKGERVYHVRGFRGAYFADDGALYADFPKFQQTERTIARLDLATRQMSEHSRFAEGRVWQRGGYVVYLKPAKKGGSLSENVTLTVSDTRTSAEFWSRDFPRESPRVFTEEDEGTMVLVWDARSEHAKAEIKSDRALAERLAALKEKEGDYFVQTLDARTGKPAGSLLVETGKGSFRIADAFAAGDWLVVSDTSNRVLLYSVSTGEQKGKFFGRAPAISKTAGLLAVETERGQLTVYDLASGERKDQFTFSAPVALVHFSADGRRLFVLTADQTAYVLDLSQAAQGH